MYVEIGCLKNIPGERLGASHKGRQWCELVTPPPRMWTPARLGEQSTAMTRTSTDGQFGVELLDDAARLADYLDAGVLLSKGSSLELDVLDPGGEALVEVGTRGDDVFRWGLSSGWYLRHYGYDPTGRVTTQIVSHTRSRGYQMPELRPEQVSRIRDAFAVDLQRVYW